jgi:hypothetical protein
MWEKSFFKRMISLAALATSVPTFMAKPTLAFFRAGASLVPSPVTATLQKFLLSSSIHLGVYGDFWRPFTSSYLSIGVDLAITLKCFAMLLNKFWSKNSNSPKPQPASYAE